MTVSEIMLYGKVYQWATQQAYHEMPVRCVPCGCGADVDEFCMFRMGRGRVPHADRRIALGRWKKENPDEYESFKQELVEHYIRLAVKEMAGENG